MLTPDNLAEEQLQQELREMFIVDTQQQLETYFDVVQRLQPESWIADIQSLYRAIHTIKGGAVTVEADSILYSAMALEDLLSDLRYLEVAPPLDDGKPIEMLLEAGELLASCLEIGDGSSNDPSGDRVQLTIQRLQTLHSQVRDRYLPDWNQMRQVHQEFAEQGFDLVVLDLEMALAKIPDRGVVSPQIVANAQATIAQLTQIGTEIELAPGWTQLLQFGDRLISDPDPQLWQVVWLPYFQVLKTCVKNSGEIDPEEIARLDALANSRDNADSGTPLSVDLTWDLDDDLSGAGDDLSGLLNEILVAAEIAPDSLTVISSAQSLATQSEDSTEVAEIELWSEATIEQLDEFGSLEDEADDDLPDLLDNFFGSGEILPLASARSLEIESEDSAEVSQIELWSETTIEQLDEFGSLEDEADVAIAEVSEIERWSEATIEQLDEFGSLEDEADDDLPDLLDNFFGSGEILPLASARSLEIQSKDSAEVAQIELWSENTVEQLDEFGSIEDEADAAITEVAEIDRWSEATLEQLDESDSVEIEAEGDLSDLLDNFFIEERAQIEITTSDFHLAPPGSQPLAADSPAEKLAEAQNFDRAESDEFIELDEFDLLAEIESELAAKNEPLTTAAPGSVVTEREHRQSSIEPAALKRGVSIPVPLERLDRSAQQVVDTLLTARSVMNASSRLQSQLSQLNALTQESSRSIAALRQLQDNYALMQNISDDRDAGNNVSIERYRQGYITIVQLLENLLRMSELGQEIEATNYDSHDRIEALDRSIVRLKDGIETSRLVPFRNLTIRAKAILRDLTNRYGKPAELIVENERVEMDAGIVQQLEPALLHILRNAYDHGLETVEQRLAQGKPAQGTIRVSLHRRGNLYRLTIEDDGRGIDGDVIYSLAESKGFAIERQDPERSGLPLTESEILAIICQPGFSSSNTINEVSGRGVGMDVVVAQLASIGGKLSLNTSVGRGTKLTLEVPAPQLLVPCVLFQVGDRTVAFPTEEVLETALLSSLCANMSADDRGGICAWTLATSRGEMPGFDLANYWQFTQRSLPETAICIRTRQGTDNMEIWSIADDLIGQSQLLINPLPSPLVAPAGLLGVSLQSDGRLISILDPIALTAKLAIAANRDLDAGAIALGLAQDNVAKHESVTPSVPNLPSGDNATIPTILIVDDAALIRRRFEASLSIAGFVTHTCNDGLEALNWLQSNPLPDLMITDVEMPNMDGFTLIDRLRQANIALPILVVSSRSSEEWRKEARRLGANDYLNKGFSTAEMLQKVNSLLGSVVSQKAFGR
ncbi:response regulator [Chamaesiphon minutus]|uniref:histidine kinase n=1 Tax=Chamaesiphon minutus (strain ATCC 27169 / PCC 6605) TaxID=1173020 RepID=K9UMD9_CHAP6|nr:response regulator [Chamaesiphon minutus]AFY95803.1 chemotaxis protein histidine kinase-like protein [Chamaesiphon minutus PCC 6605]